MAKRKIQELTTGVHDFPTLIGDRENKYVDKTDLLYELARKETDAQYFISRPRRFGKSLMLSTLQAMFEGRRDLFKGLAIDKEDWEGWTAPTPVYSFTMSNANGDSYAEVKEALAGMVEGLCGEIGRDYDHRKGVAYNFNSFLKAAAKLSPKKKIVVLIDEYDEPVAKFLDDHETLEKVRNLLHDFYEKLKINSDVIRFLMMTGVTKLTKLAVFSGLTHLTDLSLSPRFATLLGYTPEELDGPLGENVEALGDRLGISRDAARAKILEWYDGYRFSPQSERRVINPVSLGKLLGKDGGVLKSYWETTGSSTLVFNRIRASGALPDDLEHVPADPMTLDVCDALTLPVESLLYQSGYLTIKEVIPAPEQTPEEAERDPKTESYVLGPPNLEIRASLKRGYISRVLGMKEGPFDTLVDRAKRQIASGDIREVVETMLFSLYAQVPPDWRIANEAEAKRYFQLFFAMLGADPAPEFPSARGYADAVVQRPDAVYVFEFKYNKSSKAAMRQIRERGYADKWKGGKRPVTLIGINFSSRKRNIDIPVIEAL